MTHYPYAALCAPDLVAFRHDPLPVRGTANDALLEAARRAVADGAWLSIVELDAYHPSPVERFGTGSSHAELATALASLPGREVAIGTEPFDRPWGGRSAADRQEMLHLSVRQSPAHAASDRADPARHSPALREWGRGEGAGHD